MTREEESGSGFTSVTTMRYWARPLWDGPWFLQHPRFADQNAIWRRWFWIPQNGRTMRRMCLVGPAVQRKAA